MKRTLIATAFCIAWILPSAPAAGNSAEVRLSSDSVNMNPGTCSCGFGMVWTMYFSSLFTDQPAWTNGEIMPLTQPAGYSHWTYLVLLDPSLYAGTTYAELNLPLGTDANGNGTPDFFEASQPLTTTTYGAYAVIWGSGWGQLRLEWTRNPGSRQGSCRLYMNDPILGQMGPFNHTFELVDYTGQLTYEPAANELAGTVTLARAGHPANVLTGAVALIKSETNRFDLLTLSGGAWTTQDGTFTFENCELTRDPAHPNVYRGKLQNPYGAYRFWSLTVVDTNDANGNGIPDLSDDPPGITPPRRPLLSIARNGSDLLLSVSGDPGRTHLVQQAMTPDSPEWTTIQSVVLTNNPQVVTIPLPSDGASFWRVQAQ